MNVKIFWGVMPFVGLLVTLVGSHWIFVK